MRFEEELLQGTAQGTVLTGCLDGVDRRGRVRFRPDGAVAGSPVAIATPIPDGDLARAAAEGARAVVLGCREDPAGWVLVGLVRDGIAPDAPDSDDEPAEEVVEMEGGRPDVAEIDGRTVRFTARDEIVLQCGPGSITLRKDGKIVIKGTHLLSRATGTHRIKGGSVNIN